MNATHQLLVFYANTRNASPIWGWLAESEKATGLPLTEDDDWIGRLWEFKLTGRLLLWVGSKEECTSLAALLTKNEGVQATVVDVEQQLASLNTHQIDVELIDYEGVDVEKISRVIDEATEVFTGWVGSQLAEEGTATFGLGAPEQLEEIRKHISFGFTNLGLRHVVRIVPL